ncbi:hypothetical protein ACFL1M_01530 [Patescibacteria group bacterium]
MKQLTGKKAMVLVKKIEGPFKGLPHLPKGLVDFLVSVAPWFVGLAGLMGVWGGLSSLFWSGRRGLMWEYVERFSGISNTYFVLTAVISILSGVLMLMAFSHLKNMKLEGWMLLFWANVLAILQSVLGIVFAYGGIVGTLLSALFGFYFLFEVKPKYKK